METMTATRADARTEWENPMATDPITRENAENDDNSKKIVIESRFGPVSINTDQSIFFPHGLIGLDHNLHFAMSDIPSRNLGGLKLLQNLNDATLSFVVLPLNLENALIEKQDLVEACSILNINQENLLTLLIVCVHRTPEGSKVTANLRAPVIIDVKDKMGIQYVFPHNKYDVSYEISQ